MSTLLSDLDSRGLTPDLEPYCLPSGNATTSDMPPSVVKMMEIGHTRGKIGRDPTGNKKSFSNDPRAAQLSGGNIVCVGRQLSAFQQQPPSKQMRCVAWLEDDARVELSRFWLIRFFFPAYE